MLRITSKTNSSCHIKAQHNDQNTLITDNVGLAGQWITESTGNWAPLSHRPRSTRNKYITCINTENRKTMPVAISRATRYRSMHIHQRRGRQISHAPNNRPPPSLLGGNDLRSHQPQRRTNHYAPCQHNENNIAIFPISSW